MVVLGQSGLGVYMGREEGQWGMYPNQSYPN